MLLAATAYTCRGIVYGNARFETLADAYLWQF
jgi:hypothetical protein